MESKSEAAKPAQAKAAAQPTADGRKPQARTETLTPKRVFVVSPIGSPGSEPYKKAAYALKFIFRRALQPPEWEVHRADEGKLSDSIGQHVIRSIVEADLVIADLTGHNPNVFYELAVAHAFKKPVVHLISKGERLPFDVFDQRTIHYDISDLESVEDAVKDVRQYAEAVLDKSAEVINPLTNYAAFDRIRSGGSGEGASDAVADLLEQVVARLSNLEQTVTASRLRANHRPYTVSSYDAVKVDTNRLIGSEWLTDKANIKSITVEELGRQTKEQQDRNLGLFKSPMQMGDE